VAKITEYGAVGDEKTLNTAAFAKAVADLSARARRGGAALVVPPGKWLTGPFNLTSHFTLYLDEGAEILASQVRTFLPPLSSRRHFLGFHSPTVGTPCFSRENRPCNGALGPVTTQQFNRMTCGPQENHSRGFTSQPH